MSSHPDLEDEMQNVEDHTVSLFSTKITPVIKAEIKDALDDLNSKQALRGTIKPDELLLILIQSSLKVSTDELKDFVQALPKAQSDRGQAVIAIEDLKRLIN